MDTICATFHVLMRFLSKFQRRTNNPTEVLYKPFETLLLITDFQNLGLIPVPTILGITVPCKALRLSPHFSQLSRLYNIADFPKAHGWQDNTHHFQAIACFGLWFFVSLGTLSNLSQDFIAGLSVIYHHHFPINCPYAQSTDGCCRN